MENTVKYDSAYFLEMIENCKNDLSDINEISKNLLVFTHEGSNSEEEDDGAWCYDASVATLKIQAVKDMFSERETTLNKILEFYISEYNRSCGN